MTAGGVQMLLDGAWVTIWISLVAIALVRSLVRYLRAQGGLAPPRPTPALELTASYCAYLESVRGLVPAP